MPSWAVPIEWRVGDMAATASSTSTMDMNQQVFGNMDWLGTTHSHSGGTDGNSSLGPVAWVDLFRAADPSSAGASTARVFGGTGAISGSDGEVFFFTGAGVATVQLISTGHTHGY